MPLLITAMNLRIISPNDDKHYFFGYYDLMPYSFDGSKHLAHQVDFMDRRPVMEDYANVGYIDTRDGQFYKIAATSAWNFQQGALLQWIGKDKVVFNERTLQGYSSAIYDLGGRRIGRTDLPMACISSSGGLGLSLNFSRIYDFRPGYGYYGLKDEYYDVNAPTQDGIFLTDIAKGQSKLLISYAQMAEAFAELPYSKLKLVVNHITFNPRGDRFCFLLRNFPSPDEGKWRTKLVVATVDGKMTALTDYVVNSHYHWRGNDELLIFAGLEGGYGLYLFDVISGKHTHIFPGQVTEDIHCLYSPDRKTIIGDGYPDEKEERGIFLLDNRTDSCKVLLRVRSVIPDDIDIRCDLHARWDQAGDSISFDTTHNGKRQIAEVRVNGEE